MVFKGLITVFLLFMMVSSYAQVGSPLPADADTIALWNFDSDNGDTVVDGAASPIDGTAFNAPLAPVPSLDPLFNNGRSFSASNSFVDLGQTEGTKLDLVGSETLTLEAIVRRTGDAQGNHTIYENRQVQLLVIDNQLAGFVAQSGGFLGLISSNILELDTNYRVAMVLNQNYLSLFVNGQSVGSVKINEPVASIIDPNFHGFIGGSILGEYFPGHIDDVRLSSVARLDNVPPVVTQIQPIPGSSVNEARPVFQITFSDDSNIDVGSIEVYLNGVLQSGISRDATGINGQMDDDLIGGQLNTIRVVVKDELGNRADESFILLRGAVGGRDEYTSDADTLALWHMNGPVNGLIEDSSSFNNHAFNPVNQSSGTVVTEGIFGNGREFAGFGKYNAPPIRLPGQKFTFETWLRPNNDSTGTLFDSDQIEIQRRTTGFIRVILRPRIGTFDFETLLDAFPAGEKHHLAVTWDGTRANNNLVIYKDGIIVQIFDAPNNCDFNPSPVVSEIGNGFNGMLDEMRVSSVVRSTFNVPTFKEEGIFFQTLTDGTSVNTEFPQVNVDINSLITVTPSNVSVYLNGDDQTASAGLTITSTKVSGVLDSALIPGLNSLEVIYRDDENNQKRKKHHFFYIENGGGEAYTADANTAALLHLDSPNQSEIIDSSDNNYPFIATSPTSIQIVPGVIGNARRGSNLESNGQIVDLGVRSFTMEGLFKRRQDTTPNNFDNTLMRINRSGFNSRVDLNPSTGKLRVSFSTSSDSFTQDINGAVPIDDDYHHIAVVFDPSREFYQYLVLVDGQVKLAKNYDCHCNFAGPVEFSIDESAAFESDEVRLSKVARYTLNFDTSDRPDIIGFNPAVESTIRTLTPSVEYTFSDPNGISVSGTYLLVNGVLQDQLSLNVSGFNGTLSGQVEDLIPGANEFELHVKNGSGFEEIKKFFVFVIFNGGNTAYTSDVDTVALYHMDETTGSVLSDSSGNGADFNLEGTFELTVSGVFSSSGVLVNSHQSLTTNIPELLDLDTYTLEGWVKFGNVSDGLEVFRVGGLRLTFDSFSDGRMRFTNNSSQSTTLENAITDLNFHHVAAIFDPSNPNRNLLLLIDGEVRASIKVSDVSPYTLTSEELGLIRNISFGPAVDEFRVSKTARYTLNYSEVKKLLTRK